MVSSASSALRDAVFLRYFRLGKCALVNFLQYLYLHLEVLWWAVRAPARHDAWNRDNVSRTAHRSIEGHHVIGCHGYLELETLEALPRELARS